MSALSPLIQALRAEAVALVDEADAFERAGGPNQQFEIIFRALANAKISAADALEAREAALADKFGLGPKRGE
jgi:hypothetical protein